MKGYDRKFRNALAIAALLCFLSAAAGMALGWGPEAVPMPAHNGKGPYGLTVEKERDLAPLSHNPQEKWKYYHQEALASGDFSERVCLRCHTVRNHCNRCHGYLGVKHIYGHQAQMSGGGMVK
ncbi:MAG: hypothetical protein RDV48_28965 [Candidatus Eremiobacteraeota bacterium]|nr:hypothetical protein [Candidatus Eremiobacteraeota bacterium]